MVHPDDRLDGPQPAEPIPDTSTAGDPAGPLHAVDRRLDLAFAALTDASDLSFIHCLGERAAPGERSALLDERLPDARWISADTHALTYIDPADHLRVHHAWLEACHGPDRIGRATVRTVQPLQADDDGEPGPVGLYDAVLIDLIGTPGIDAVVVILSERTTEVDRPLVQLPPPRGAASFRIRLDLDGVIRGGTASVALLLGRELDELVGTEVAPLIHPDDLDQASGVWEDVLAKPDQSQTIRIRLLHADGSWRWFSDTAWNALHDPDEPGVLSEFHDIRALVEAEQALYASELGFRTLAESLPVGVAVLDQNGLVTFANHQLVSLLTSVGALGPDVPGPAAEPVGDAFATAWTDLVHPELAAQVADLLTPGDPSAYAPASRQIQLLDAHGQAVHLLVQAVTIWMQDGRSVIVSLQDVSNEVLTGKAHARLLQVVDEVGDLVLVGQVGGDVTYLNHAARRFLGDHALGQPVSAFIGSDLDGLEPWTGDLDVLDGDGATHTMATTVSPVADSLGSDELFVGVTMRDVTAKRVHERELARLARRDALTGLPNRFALMELLDGARSGEGERSDDIAVFFIDLDNLKIVNDGLGHSAGDLLLVEVANELRRAADEGADTVARFGGDEFVVVCEGVGPDAAIERAERFLAAVERAEVAGVSTHVSASIGVATAPRQVVDAESLIRDADAAMYAAKRAGRSRCALFDDSLRTRVTQRFQLEASLRASIESTGLDVHFQPVVSLESGTVTGVEALCRWSGASPADFIPVAEESGLILPLGAQVFAKALRGVAALRAEVPGAGGLRVGINVSARELDQPNFAEHTLAVIAASEVPADHVVIELTESVLIDPRDEVDACLRQLREAGVALALDDFGSGYSSLGYLRRYPIDILKLDISYTQAMVDDLETRVIVEALASMASRLGLRVVAEGVETAEQLAIVAELGLDWVQGFLVGRPAPVEDLIASGLRPLIDL